MDISEKRKQKRVATQMIPENVPGELGLVQVDVTWGIIQPMQAAKNISTVGELDVHNYQEQELPIVDVRTAGTTDDATILGSKHIPHDEIVKRIDELDRAQPTIFFCNGPQCPQTPAAIRDLLEAGYPPDKILYYRGGMHDWITLGLS